MTDEETPAYGVGRDGAAPQPPTRPRQDLTNLTLGEFHVKRLLGRGGMGEVYLARQVTLDREVALKVLKPELLSNPTYLARFEKEAHVAARLNHPNIVHIYSFGGFDNLKFIAMEYVHGTNLRDYLARKERVELPLALSIMKQAGQALAAASALGLVHRDIKPENLLLTRKGQVKVADFGLCRAPEGPEAMALTQEGVTLGTPMYMSPEQVQGRDLDPRSDLYSLGVTFYHMLSGVPPFKGDSPLALALKHVREEPVDLSVRRPDLHPDLIAFVMKLLRKDPAERFQSATEMLRELGRIKEAVLAKPVAESLPSVTEETTAVEDSNVSEAPPRPHWGLAGFPRPRRWQVAGLLAASLGVGALLGAGGRSQNLLSKNAPQYTGPAGLWIADWESIPRFESAAMQYRHALLKASPSRREAAWLAVVGRFPNERQWATQAYIQLVRALFRRGDVEDLGFLAGEFERDGGSNAALLAKVSRAAIAALRREPEGVLEAYNGVDVGLQDSGMNELGLEIALRARRDARENAGVAKRLLTLQSQLAEALQIQPLISWDMIQLD